MVQIDKFVITVMSTILTLGACWARSLERTVCWYFGTPCGTLNNGMLPLTFTNESKSRSVYNLMNGTFSPSLAPSQAWVDAARESGVVHTREPLCNNIKKSIPGSMSCGSKADSADSEAGPKCVFFLGLQTIAQMTS